VYLNNISSNDRKVAEHKDISPQAESSNKIVKK